MEIVSEDKSIEKVGSKISVLLRDKEEFKWEQVDLDDFTWNEWQGVDTITLKEIYEQAEEMFGWIAIEVVYELGLKGWIYRYDRNVYDWVLHGTTKGYA